MRLAHRTAYLAGGAALIAAAALASVSIVGARTSISIAGAANTHTAAIPTAAYHTWLRVKRIGTLSNGSPKLTSTTPTGLSPAAVASVYNLSGLSATSGAGAGQTIAIVDAFHDPNALADLNTFSAQYGYPALSPCTSLTQSGSCFEQASPNHKKVRTNSSWALEESLDIEWAHAEAPAAKIVLVEATSNSTSNLFAGVSYANSLGATEVSMSWGGLESGAETTLDSNFTHAGTLYTVSAGDSGHGAHYPASSPNVISVGGTTLNGCIATSCVGFTSETAWTSGSGGASAFEAIPSYQTSYAGRTFGDATISALTGGFRGTPDVSFDASPNTGVSVYDSTTFSGQSGWFTLGGTSVGAPNWAGILAAGAAAGKTALQGNAAIYSGGYSTNLRDVTSGTNGTCGTDCTAGTGYDLVTGLGSPIDYP